MIICVAVDDKLGMMFHNRRQSQDKVLREHMVRECKGTRLWMNQYSKEQFEDLPVENIVVDECFLDKAGEDEYCFVENVSLAEYEEGIKKLILFKWNRVYPADRYLDVKLLEHGWQLTSLMEFEGNSHQKITKEIWENGKREEHI